MTFDLEAARDLAMRCAYFDPMPEEILPRFVAALDEIARQNASLDDAEALIRKNAETMNAQAKRIAELEADKKFWQDRSQTLREVCNAAELQSNKQRAALKKLGRKYHEQREGRQSDARLYDASQTAMASQIMKLQEALVEERASKNFRFGLGDACIVPVDDLQPDFDFKGCSECEIDTCPYRSWWLSDAKRQLRREGLL